MATTKYTIKANPSKDFSFAWRAKRSWPREALVVEVIDEENDPEMPPSLRLGQASLRALMEDPRFSVVIAPAGAVIGIPPAVSRSEDARLLEEKLRVQAEKAVAMERTVESLKAQIAAMQAEHVPAVPPVNAGQQKPQARG